MPYMNLKWWPLIVIFTLSLFLQCSKDPIEIATGKIDGLNGKLIFHRSEYNKDGKFITLDFNSDESYEFALLTSNGAIRESSISISSDAEKLSYAGVNKDLDLFLQIGFQLFVSNLDGTNQYMIKYGTNSNNRIYPTLHPDGESVFYINGSINGGYIYHSKVDGSEINQITDFKVCLNMSISKDGTNLLFTKGLRFNNEGIFIYNITDKSLRKIVPSAPNLTLLNPEFSPDDYKIAYLVRGGPSNEAPSFFRIMTVNIDASDENVVVDLPSEEHIVDPKVTWSPDGSKLAFDYGSGINNELKSHIYIINLEGSDMIQITESPGYDTRPVWIN